MASLIDRRQFVGGAAALTAEALGLASGGWRRAYYGSNYSRLLDVQRRVDPHHFFYFPRAIGS